MYQSMTDKQWINLHLNWLAIRREREGVRGKEGGGEGRRERGKEREGGGGGE